MAPNDQLARFNPLAGRSFDQAMEDFEEQGGTAPVIGEDGSMQIGAVTLLPTGLKIAGRIDEDEWLKVGGALRKLQTSLQWLIGDWMAYGEREYGKTYEEVAALFGYAVKTLQNLVWICTHVKTSLRREVLDIGHHALVAGMPMDEQRKWLTLAAAMQPRPTVRQLDALIKGIELPAPAKGVARLVQHELAVRSRFEQAARTKKAEKLAELRAFAQVQAEYWKSAVEALSESKGS